MGSATDRAGSLCVTRRTLLFAGVASVAAGAVECASGPDTAATAATRPRGVTFTTTGATFSPAIELTPSSSATVTWFDEAGRELAQGTNPTIDFGSQGTRKVIMVTSFSDVRTVNLGFNTDQDGGEYSLPSSYNKEPEAVSGVSGVTRLKHLRRFLAGGTPLGGSLDVSGLKYLTHVECYHAQVASINLKGCTSLVRLCLEANNVRKLDLNPVAGTLRDLRAAAQQSGRLEFATLHKPLARLYHFCVRDQVIKRHPHASKLPACRELWNWNCAQTGALPKPGAAQSVLAAGNSYTSASFKGQWKDASDQGVLDLTGNRLTSVKVTGCRGLSSIRLGGNALSQRDVDGILAEVTSWGTSGSHLVLDGANAAPSAAGLLCAATLSSRGWEVTLSSL